MAADRRDWLDESRLTVERRFDSVKNRVELVRDPSGRRAVRKVYPGPDGLARELAGRRRFGAQRPRILAQGKTHLLLECIEGPTLLFVYEACEREGGDTEALADLILRTLRGLHDRASGFILGDVNLRNFIQETGGADGLCCVDYEDAKEGDPEEDLGRMLAFLQTYRPVDTPWKRSFTRRLFQAGVDAGYDGARMRRYWRDELDAIEARREGCAGVDIPDLETGQT